MNDKACDDSCGAPFTTNLQVLLKLKRTTVGCPCYNGQSSHLRASRVDENDSRRSKYEHRPNRLLALVMARLSAWLYDVPAPQATLTHPSRTNPVKQNTVPTSLRRRLRSPAHVFGNNAPRIKSATSTSRKRRADRSSTTSPKRRNPSKRHALRHHNRQFAMVVSHRTPQIPSGSFDDDLQAAGPQRLSEPQRGQWHP